KDRTRIGRLHRQLRLQTDEVATDRRHGQRAVAPYIADGAVALERAVDLDAVPFLGMAHVVDRDVVVLAPEEGDGVKRLAVAEHVPGSRLALPLGHYPMLDSDAVACVWIRPPRDVACGKNAGHARFEILVDADPAVDG